MSLSNQPEHVVALSKAKIGLMARPDSAFFTTICFSLKHQFKDVGTAATDGKTIFFDPKFFMSLDQEQRIFLLLHEAMHVAYLHVDKDRMNGRNHDKWNRAADYVINWQLHERGFKMPPVGLLDEAYKGMSTEEVYKILPEQESKPYPKDLIPSDQPSEQLQSDVQDILIRAAIQSKMAQDKPGTIPGDIQIFLDRLLNPKLPWNRILQKYLRAFAKSDYTFKRPNRRFFPKYHLPSLHGEALMNIAIAVDASSSVSDSDFNRFVSETAGILKMMKPEKITLVQFATEIKSVDEITNIQELMRCKFTGRGGTMISPVIQWANENKPQVLLVFTDGEFYFYDYPSKVEVLWLIHNNEGFTAPYGKVVHYEL